MNGNVIALAREAGCSMLYDYSAEGHAMVLNCNNLDKFAELLIERCIEAVRSCPTKPNDTDEDSIELGLLYAENAIRYEFEIWVKNNEDQ